MCDDTNKWRVILQVAQGKANECLLNYGDHKILGAAQIGTLLAQTVPDYGKCEGLRQEIVNLY